MKMPLVLSVVALAASGQTPAFEVASIKPNRSVGGMTPSTFPRGVYRWRMFH